MFRICAGKERYSDYGHRFCMSRFALRNANEYSPMQIPASRAAPILAHRHHRCWPFAPNQTPCVTGRFCAKSNTVGRTLHFVESWRNFSSQGLASHTETQGLSRCASGPGEALRELIAQKPRDSPALQTPQSVFFHRGWNCHVDFINPPQRFFVENQSVSAEAFVQLRDGGGSDDG